MKRMNLLVVVLAAGTGSAARSGDTMLAESTFDDGPQGWTLTVSTTWDGAMGSPGGCLLGAVEEPTNATAVAFASEAFHGDWSSLDEGRGELRFDFALFSIGGGTVNGFLPVDVVISGPGGVARWIGPTIEEPTPYQTLVVPIEEGEWQVTEGEWAVIIDTVQSVRFRLETVDNSSPTEDRQAIDNVRLVRLADPCPGDVNLDGFVNLDDLDLVLSNFGQTTTSGDADGNGVVNLDDLDIVLSNFGTVCN